MIGATPVGDQLIVGFNFWYPVGPTSGPYGAQGYSNAVRSALWLSDEKLESWTPAQLPFGPES